MKSDFAKRYFRASQFSSVGHTSFLFTECSLLLVAMEKIIESDIDINIHKSELPQSGKKASERYIYFWNLTFLPKENKQEIFPTRDHENSCSRTRTFSF